MTERTESTDSAPTLALEPTKAEDKAGATDLSDKSPPPTSSAPPALSPPPDGGLEAWLVILGTALVLFTMFGLMTSFGQLMLYYMEHQLRDRSKADIAWISSVQGGVMFMGSTLSGRVFDVYGTKWLVRIGTTCSFAALIAIAFCKEYYQFMLAHLFFGIAGAFVYSPSTAIAGHWFTTRRSTAMGVILAGTGLAGVLYPIVLARLFARFSFRDSMLIVAGINAVLMAPSWVWMKARLPRKTPPPWADLLKPWREPPYACLGAGAALVMLNWFTPYFQAPLYTSASALAPKYTTYAVTLVQTGATVGRLGGGVLADHFGAWRMFFTFGTATAVSLFAFWVVFPTPTPVAVIGLVSYGLTSGAYVTLVAGACATVSPLPELGMRMGMVWSIGGALSIVGPAISGQLIERAGGRFTYAAVWSGCTILAGVWIANAPKILLVARRVLGRKEQQQPLA
ncbi:hypothetical protein VHUM_01827 [Vanrija humicola]|uniref:Major facilitator superfamily (MFS) profile domain-containing protein n=1 Tax=Vanrija humicola TaxID=5417 RepID=A0A7D8Z167_VANHU|nr:hypothetical protein VHUM_01827 [Vanrija humicola]